MGSIDGKRTEIKIERKGTFKQKVDSQCFEIPVFQLN
jgi:hypothetical protein